jgi:hypothetical protein
MPAAISVSSDNGICTLDSSADSVHCDIGLLGVGALSNIVINAIAHPPAPRVRPRRLLSLTIA